MLGAVVMVAGTVYAAPNLTYLRTVLPEATDSFDLGTTTRVWRDLYVGEICLSGDCKTAWPTGSGGSGSGTWATTTSTHSGRLINYPLNATDIVTIGSNSTTTAEYYFDPNTLFAYLSGLTTLVNATTTQLTTTGATYLATSGGNVGIGTNTVSTANLSVVGNTSGVQFVARAAGSAGLSILGWSATDVNLDPVVASSKLRFGRDTSLAQTTFESGNVGIGSTTPGYKLSVAGSGFFDGGTVTASVLIATSSFSTPSLTLSGTAINSILSTNASGAIVATSTITANNIWATSTSLTNYFAGNVGVGTTTIGQKLTVDGNIFLASNANYIYGKTTGGSATRILGINGANDVYFGSVDADISAFHFQDNGSDRMTIDSNGNVGIGTGAPTAKLEITGLSSSPNNGLFVTTNTWSSMSAGSAVRIGTGATSGNTYGVIDVLQSGGAQGNGNLAIAPLGGNVGIGTTTPAWKFQVAGTRPDFAISDSASGVGSKHILFSNRGGNLYIGTSTDLYATSTTPFISLIASTGEVATRFISVLTKFVGVISSAFTPSTEGEIGIDTTSNQFKYFSGGAVRVVAPDIETAFVLATSTLGTGTTTLKVAGYSRPTTYTKFGCNSMGSGTFVARLGDSNASSTSVVSATGLTTTFTTLSSNNSFTAGETVWYEIGSVSGTVINPTCGYTRTIDAD